MTAPDIALRLAASAKEQHAPPAGWVLYDGSCGMCLSFVRRFGQVLERRGFALVPLQEPWVKERLGLADDALLEELRVLTPDGRTIGGADAFVHMSRRVWWAWPFWLVSWVPGARPVMRRVYRWIAARRACASGACARSG